jgi:hypothetical protein
VSSIWNLFGQAAFAVCETIVWIMFLTSLECFAARSSAEHLMRWFFSSLEL